MSSGIAARAADETMRAPTRLPRPREVTGGIGIYAHVPFCTHRCWYCDFNAYSGLEHLSSAYMAALARDVEGATSAHPDADLGTRPQVSSIFIGGGTPSLVPADGIARFVRAVRESWPVDPGAEVTIECNPESLDASKIDAYLEAGIGRLSIGVQSLDPQLLARLGRTHSAARATEALRLARERGFGNVSADLIFGVPGEDDASWRASIEGVLGCEPSHVSCYALTYEEGTPIDAWRRTGRIVPVEEDEVADRWQTAEAMLSAAGLVRYEISNWARPGAESVHNSLYWRCGEYLGVGAGAHSHLAVRADAQPDDDDDCPAAGAVAVRSWTLRAPNGYIDAVARGTTLAGSEQIDRRTRAGEVMILGLRTTAGVSEADFAGLVGLGLDEVFPQELAEGTRRGLIARDGRRVRLIDPLLGNAAAVLFA